MTTRLEKHRRLVQAGKLFVDASKELNEIRSKKDFCPTCGQDLPQTKILGTESSSNGVNKV